MVTGSKWFLSLGHPAGCVDSRSVWGRRSTCVNLRWGRRRASSHACLAKRHDGMDGGGGSARDGSVSESEFSLYLGPLFK